MKPSKSCFNQQLDCFIWIFYVLPFWLEKFINLVLIKAHWNEFQFDHILSMNICIWCLTIIWFFITVFARFPQKWRLIRLIFFCFKSFLLFEINRCAVRSFVLIEFINPFKKVVHQYLLFSNITITNLSNKV